MASPSLKTIGTYALVLVGAATLVVLSSLALRPVRVSGTARTTTAPDPLATPEILAPVTAGNTAAPTGAGKNSCTAAPAASVSPSSLRQAQIRGRELLEQQHFDEALVRFRSIAAMDAALPGINLDLSSAFLKLHQNEAAQKAINAQINTSDCLLRLPAVTLDEYCKAQLPHTSAPECRQELASIARSAHFQSALVQMELGNNLGGAGNAGPSATADTLLPQSSGSRNRQKPANRAVSAAAADGPVKAKAAAPARRPNQNPLAGAAGTDADLGAYSKQP